MDAETLKDQARAARITTLHEVSLDQIVWRRFQSWDGLDALLESLAQPVPNSARVPPPNGASEPPVVGGGADGGHPMAPESGGRSARTLYGLILSICGLFTFGLLCPLGVLLCASTVWNVRDRSVALSGIVIGGLGIIGWMMGLAVLLFFS